MKEKTVVKKNATRNQKHRPMPGSAYQQDVMQSDVHRKWS